MTNKPSIHAVSEVGNETELSRFRWWYFAESRLKVLWQYFSVIVVSSLGQPLLIMLVMGLGLGGLISANTGDVDGVSYLQFIAPALLTSSALMAASSEFGYEIMGAFKWRKTYFGAAATSLTPGHILGGQITTVVIRFLIETALIMGLLAVFGLFTSWWALLNFLVVPVVGLSIGLPMGAYVANIESDRGQIALLQRFIIMPLFLFSGTFYQLETLPWPAQVIGWISPQWHGAQVARVLSYGSDQPGWLIITHLTFLLVTAMIGGLLMFRVFRRRLGSQ